MQLDLADDHQALLQLIETIDDKNGDKNRRSELTDQLHRYRVVLANLQAMYRPGADPEQLKKVKELEARVRRDVQIINVKRMRLIEV